MDITIIIGIATTLLFLYLFLGSGKSATKHYPPGYNGLPLVGVFPFFGKYVADDLMKWGRKLYCSVFYVNFYHERYIVLNDYDSIDQCFVKNGNSSSGRPSMKLFNDVRKNRGVVFKDFDDKLKANRKFLHSAIRTFDGTCSHLDGLVHDQMEFAIENIMKHNGKPFDIKETVFRMVNSLVCHITFGQRPDYEDKKIVTLTKGLRRNFSHDRMANDLVFLMLDYNLKSKYSNACDKFQAMYKTRTEIFKAYIKEHRSSYNKDTIRDIIDKFISQENKDTESISEEEFIFVLTDLFDAGTETSSTALHWCILYLAGHQDTQDALFKEIDDLMDEKTPKHSYRNSMPLMCSFIDEIMRHRTLNPLGAPHRTQEEIKLYRYTIPKNTNIVPNLWSAHHDPNVFEEPESFQADRFIDKETGKYTENEKLFPFSLGPRKCVGSEMAERSIFLILTSLLQRFKFTADSSHPLPDFNKGTMGIVHFPPDFKVRCIQRG